MFEVGKLSDETLDSFLMELEKVIPYYRTQNRLRDTVDRQSPALCLY